METSPLNKLSREMRDRIYELTLTRPSPVVIQPLAGNTMEYGHTVTKIILYCPTVVDEALAVTLTALRSTCTQTRDEATPFVFGSNAFEIRRSVDWDEDDSEELEIVGIVRVFLSSIGEKNAAHIKNLSIDLGVFYLEDLNTVEMSKIWKTLESLKTYLHRNGTLKAKLKFDCMDFDPLPGHDGSLTATFDLEVGDVDDAVHEVEAVLTREAETLITNTAADAVVSADIRQTFQQFGRSIEDALQQMAG
ncbi:hypothetical protein LTR85_004363 [Meristemomyces frigidus]|nr:hypothetical protein LTR85_004363 [Meristemomyces frigidus]